MDGKGTNPEELLSPEFRVAVEVYDLGQKQEDAFYSKLITELEGKVSKATISKALDNLLDSGILKADWKKNSTGKWIRVFAVAGGATQVIKETSDFLKLAKN